MLNDITKKGTRGDDTRDAIKLVARRLFALHGIDGVAVREIATAAKQRNSGSVHYYFGSKEALVQELIVDGARWIDARRTGLLEAYEQLGRPADLRAIVEILVHSSTALGQQPGEEDTYIRFIAALQNSHRKLFLDALANRWNDGYQRCLAHIRVLLQHLPEAIVQQRLVFMAFYITSALSFRESIVDAEVGIHHFWSAPYAMDNLIDTVVSMLTAAPSAQTLARL
ncbi:MAG: helix-turn-helix domain-containing protein [Pseudomonadota bacterium]